MSFLFFGGEQEDMSFGDAVDVTTTANYFRSGYARCAVSPHSDGTHLQSKSVAVQTSIWVAFQLRYNGGSLGHSENSILVGLSQSGAGLRGIFIGTGYDTNAITIDTYVGTTRTILATEGGSSIPHNAAPTRIDMQIINYGAAGTINVYAGGILKVSYTGDIRVTGVTGFDCVQTYRSGGYYGWSNNITFISELIIATESTLTAGVVTHPITAAGDSNAWTGAYTDIDDITINDADFIYTDTDAADIQCALGDLPTGTFYVLAARIAVRATCSAVSAVTKIQLGVKSGGTIDVDAGQTVTSGIWTLYDRIFTTVNGTAITPTLLNAFQLNLRAAA
jgi:hypothetical protein